MDDTAFRRWLDAYGDAWQNHDAEAIGRLFTEDAVYYITPFDTPLQGRSAIQSYWQGIALRQANVQFSAEILMAQEHTGLAHWSAEFGRVSSKKRIRLDGVLQVTFSDALLCSVFREWWHSQKT